MLVLTLDNPVGDASKLCYELIDKADAGDLVVEAECYDRILIIDRDEVCQYHDFVRYVVKPHVRELERKVRVLDDTLVCALGMLAFVLLVICTCLEGVVIKPYDFGTVAKGTIFRVQNKVCKSLLRPLLCTLFIIHQAKEAQ